MTSQFSVTSINTRFSFNAANTASQSFYEGILKKASASDEYLLERAMAEAEKDIKESKTAKVCKLLPYLTSAGLVGYAALTKQGPLSSKITAGAAMAGVFAGIDIGFKAYNKIKNKIQEKHGEKEPKQSKYPTAKAILGIIGTLAAVTAGYFGITKGAKAFSGTDLGSRVIGRLKNLGERIDNSKLAKKINTGAIDTFFAKHPNTKTALFWAPITASLLGHGVLSAKLDHEFNEETEENFEEYVEEREELRTSAKLLEQSGLVLPVV